jgi:2-haloacid dehalogenase
MPYKWLMFDLDGTLFDYNRAEQHALRSTFEQMALPFQESYLPVYREINSQLWHDFEQGLVDQDTLRLRRFERLFEALEIQCDLPAFSASYLTHLGNGAFLMAEAEETVRALQARFNLAAITNGLKDVQRTRLAVSNLGGCFKATIISEEVGAAKPAPEIFDVAFEQMGHPAKAEVLIVGDSLTSDMAGGHNYGIDTCWFNPTAQPNDHTPSTYEIRRLGELLRIVEGG